MENDIAANFADITHQIRKAERVSGRKDGATQLVAVSKTQPADALEAALATGHRVFGENKVQEAYAHWADVKPRYPDLTLRLIGPLQTNKAKEAVALFDCIETLDREKLVDALAVEMKKQGRTIPCFIQVNTGAELQKAGVLPTGLAALLDYARAAGIIVTGLMCIPPADEAPQLHFAFLKNLADRHGLSQLSMGMSSDFDRAIAAGATHVRIGTALFGERS